METVSPVRCMAMCSRSRQAGSCSPAASATISDDSWRALRGTTSRCGTRASACKSSFRDRGRDAGALGQKESARAEGPGGQPHSTRATRRRAERVPRHSCGKHEGDARASRASLKGCDTRLCTTGQSYGRADCGVACDRKVRSARRRLATEPRASVLADDRHVYGSRALPKWAGSRPGEPPRSRRRHAPPGSRQWRKRRRCTRPCATGAAEPGPPEGARPRLDRRERRRTPDSSPRAASLHHLPCTARLYGRTGRQARAARDPRSFVTPGRSS